jgi:hypothetical protein
MRRFVFAIVTVLVLLGVLEGGACLLPEAFNGRYEVVADPSGLDPAFVASAEVPGWDLAHPSGAYGPLRYTTNHWRMRGPDFSDEKSPDALRVILVGDSAIFGHMLTWEESIGGVLEGLLESGVPDRDAEVAACAAPGHSTVQSLLKLRRHCMAFQPDIVIIGNANSDRAMWDQTDRDRFHLLAYSEFGQLLGRSSLYRTLRNAYLRRAMKDQAAAQPIPQDWVDGRPRGNLHRVPLDEYARNLHEMARVSEAGGARVVLLSLPTLSLLRNAAPAPDAGYRDAMRAEAIEHGVVLADGAAYFQMLDWSENPFMDEVHPQASGAAALARMLDHTLRTQVLGTPSTR